MTPTLRNRLGNLAVGLGLAVLALWLAGLHPGPWTSAPPSRLRLLAAAACTLGWLAWVGVTVWRARAATTASRAAGGDAPWRVVWASQTGFARELAERTATALRERGEPVQLLALEQLDAATLSGGGRMLFVVSTTGEGDAPDHAAAFVERCLGQPLDLARLDYAVLALGDRSYRDFCAFGHRLDDWLAARGGQRLHDRIDVDNGDARALQVWRDWLVPQPGTGATVPVGAEDGRWSGPTCQIWCLSERSVLNPQSIGGAVFDLALSPPETNAPRWQAGDIAAIVPRHDPRQVQAWLERRQLDGDAVVADAEATPRRLRDLLQRSQLPPDDAAAADPAALAASLQPLPPREYSIASIPEEGRLRLLLRRQTGPDGRPGLGSGWLCDLAPVGAAIELRLRSNPNFHAPEPSQPLILIGNGTGVAGLRALLCARRLAGAGRNWLIYGERQQACDDYYGPEFRRWRDEGAIERLDAVFSRDGGPHRYVQDALQAQAEPLRRWVEDGAAIYVCGSLRNMAPGVDAVLEQVLGGERKQALRLQGRYRRDVY